MRHGGGEGRGVRGRETWRRRGERERERVFDGEVRRVRGWDNREEDEEGEDDESERERESSSVIQRWDVWLICWIIISLSETQISARPDDFLARRAHLLKVWSGSVRSFELTRIKTIERSNRRLYETCYEYMWFKSFIRLRWDWRWAFKWF